MIIRRGIGATYGPTDQQLGIVTPDSWFDANADAPLTCSDMAKMGVNLAGTSCAGASASSTSITGIISQYGIYIALGLAAAALFAAGGRR